MTISQDDKPWYKNGGKIFNAGSGVLDFGLTYYQERKEGASVLGAGVKAAATAAAWWYAPGVMWGMTGLSMAKSAGEAMYQYQQKSHEEQFAANDQRGIVGNGFQDNQFGYTQRQRGIAAIQQSRLNARSALMNEARSLHRF